MTNRNLLTSITLVLIFISSIFGDSSDDGIIVKIPNGALRGRKEYSLRNISFYAFQEIPYAKPPIGNLRFTDPQPAEKWDGVLDAIQNWKICYQLDAFKESIVARFQDEDCLYLNVYTPRNPSEKADLAVMFFLHGGGFETSTGQFNFFGPHYLMENDVIVVVINYRLGPFGFLSTGDKHIPGNFGLKDQQLALEWVRDNIKYFGGDPKKVTIFGQSAGAASVTYHLLNNKSKGLFRAAIAQSGSILNPFASQVKYRQHAYKLAAELDPNFNDSSSSEELLQFFRSKSADEISKAGGRFIKSIFDRTLYDGFGFSPSIGLKYKGAFVPDNPYIAIKQGDATKVPLLMGICSEEINSRFGAEFLASRLSDAEADPSNLVNENMHITDPIKKRKVGEDIRRIYTDGLFKDNIGRGIKYLSDMFNKGVIAHAQLQSAYSEVYFYQFSYYGSMPGETADINGTEKVGHADDLYYIWSRNNDTNIERYPKLDVITSERYRSLFTNFAKYLNPTPEPTELLNNIIWPKLEPDNLQYLDINETLTIQKNPKGETYFKWFDLINKWDIEITNTF